MNKLIVLSFLFLSSCGVYGTTLTPLPVPKVPLTLVQEIISDQNDYLYSIGQKPLIQGLSCTLYTIPNPTGSIVGASLTTVGTFTYLGSFNQPVSPSSVGLNVLPPNLSAQYTTWYIVKCKGAIVITSDDYHSFSLSSDDGSLLYVNGLLINNDGNHSTTTVTKTKYLRSGVYPFEIDYMQTSGQQSLILNMDGSLLPSSILFF